MPSIEKMEMTPRWIFQQDSAPCHTAKIVKEWFKDNDVPVMQWPAQSPDLNPIGTFFLAHAKSFSLVFASLYSFFTEPLWSYFKKKVHEHHPTSKADLWKWCQYEWERIPIERVRRLCYDTYQRRLDAVIKSRGWPTKY